jgi:hypothetical protein
MNPAAVKEATGNFALHLPSITGDVFSVPSELVWPLLVTAIPLGIFNFTEILNNVESAAVGGDSYNLRAVLAADGVGAIVGALLARRSRLRSISATPAGKRWAGVSVIRWRPVLRWRLSVSWGLPHCCCRSFRWSR